MNGMVKTGALSVGYGKKILLGDISFTAERGKILTLVGPNGAGKSTILKTITKQLEPIAGVVTIDEKSLSDWSQKALSKKLAVVLTERVNPELMTCFELVSMGRYPYTDLFGKLDPEDREIVWESLRRVHAEELSDRLFSTLSDGQKQRILLARALCQKPEIIVLDEPTAYLDIRYKVELLGILKQMAREEHICVILSLHEIDLAIKLSDELLFIKNDRSLVYGTPDQLFTQLPVEELYEMAEGSFDPLFGSLELKRTEGDPKVFVISGNESAVPLYRKLQKDDVPFAAGVLYRDSADHRIAEKLASCVIDAEPFEPMTEDQFQKALSVLKTCEKVLVSGRIEGSMNEVNRRLEKYAKDAGLLEP